VRSLDLYEKYFTPDPIINPVRGLFPLEKTPGLISLLAGKPNPATFPFTSLTFGARSPTDPNKELSLSLDEADLQQGLQYGDTAGLKKLCDWFAGLQTLNHGRKKNEGWRISVGSGSQDLLYKVLIISFWGQGEV
jgi:tryptophan aminotransferase